MKPGMKIFIWNILKIMHLGPLMLYIHPKSALKRLGWFKSFHKKSVIDKHGNPIPWWTYSFIDFLGDRLSDNFRILEFGCGGSTIWLSFRVKEVVSFEDYPEWASKTRKKIGGGSKIIDVKDIYDFESYQENIIGKFDVLIIDNLGNRMECAVKNLIHLNDEGVVIWDNTDGSDWSDIKQFFTIKGFKEISFTGMVAQELSYNRTTVFYREKNCLNI